MGGSMSDLFYPDNPSRRNRAEQLKNDCENQQSKYDTARANIAAVLEPLHGQLDEVLKALGCNTLAELDQKIQGTATSSVLADWNKIKNAYDTASKVEGVIWTACGIIALVGVSISAVMGVFSFGIGFVAGLELTGAITAILGVIGLIFDAINGAIQRQKLREAINKLHVTRLQITNVVDQTLAIQQVVPTIKLLYEAVITAGITDPDKIKEILVSQGSTITDNSWTFYRSAQTLYNMDRSRGSWMDEDPNWQSTANALDAARAAGMIVRSSVKSALAASGLTEDFEVTTAIPSTLLDDSDVKVVILPESGESSIPFVGKTITLHLDRFVSDDTAAVHIQDAEYQSGPNHFIIQILNDKASGGTGAAAEVYLLDPNLPTHCLLPNGEYGAPDPSAKFIVQYA